MDIFDDFSPSLNDVGLQETNIDTQTSYRSVPDESAGVTLDITPEVSTADETTSINNNVSAFVPGDLLNTAGVNPKKLVKSDCFLDFEPDTEISFATDKERANTDQVEAMETETDSNTICSHEKTIEAKDLEGIDMFRDLKAIENEVISLESSLQLEINKEQDDNDDSRTTIAASAEAMITEDIAIKSSASGPAVGDGADNLPEIVLNFPEAELQKNEDLCSVYLNENNAMQSINAEDTSATTPHIEITSSTASHLMDTSSTTSQIQDIPLVAMQAADDNDQCFDFTTMLNRKGNLFGPSAGEENTSLNLTASGTSAISETKSEIIPAVNEVIVLNENKEVSTMVSENVPSEMTITKTSEETSSTPPQDVTTNQFGSAINLSVKTTTELGLKSSLSGATGLLSTPSLDSPQLSPQPAPAAGKHHLPQMLVQAPSYRGSGARAAAGNGGGQNQAVLPLTIKKQDGQSIVIMRQVSSDGVVRTGNNPALNLSMDRTVLGATEGVSLSSPTPSTRISLTSPDPDPVVPSSSSLSVVHSSMPGLLKIKDVTAAPVSRSSSSSIQTPLTSRQTPTSQIPPTSSRSAPPTSRPPSTTQSVPISSGSSTRVTPLPSTTMLVGPFSLKQSTTTASGVTLRGLGNTTAWRAVGTTPRGASGGGGGGTWGTGQPSLLSPRTCFVSTLRPGNKIQLSMLKPAPSSSAEGVDKALPLTMTSGGGGGEKSRMVSPSVLFAGVTGSVSARPPAWKTIGGMNILRGARSIRPDHRSSSSSSSSTYLPSSSTSFSPIRLQDQRPGWKTGEEVTRRLSDLSDVKSKTKLSGAGGATAAVQEDGRREHQGMRGGRKGENTEESGSNDEGTSARGLQVTDLSDTADHDTTDGRSSVGSGTSTMMSHSVKADEEDASIDGSPDEADHHSVQSSSTTLEPRCGVSTVGHASGSGGSVERKQKRRATLDPDYDGGVEAKSLCLSPSSRSPPMDGKKSHKKKVFVWKDYLFEENARCAALSLFKTPFPQTKMGFKVGMRLEGIDPHHPALYCVLSVAEVRASRMRLHFDFFSECYDFWVNSDSPYVFPPGWAEKNGKLLQLPRGMSMDSFDWTNYLKSTNSVGAPKSLFPHIHSSAVPLTGVRPGMKLEAVDKKSTSMTCVASVVDTLGDRILVHFDGWEDIYDYWADMSSPYIHPVGWCQENAKPISPPNDCKDIAGFTWEEYLASTRTQAVPAKLFKQREPHRFEVGHKLEAVDRRNPMLIRVATIVEVEPHRLKIHFDGWPDIYDYWEDDDSPDLHPGGWCYKTGHTLTAPLSHADILSPSTQQGICPTPGCTGIGHIKGAKYTGHHSAFGCPYSALNMNKEFTLPDRLGPQRGSESGGGGGGGASSASLTVNVKHHKAINGGGSSGGLSPPDKMKFRCPTVGCDGVGHITGRYTAHYRQSGCPIYLSKKYNHHSSSHNNSSAAHSRDSVGGEEGGQDSPKVSDTERSMVNHSNVSLRHEERPLFGPGSGRGRKKKKILRLIQKQKELEATCNAAVAASAASAASMAAVSTAVSVVDDTSSMLRGIHQSVFMPNQLVSPVKRELPPSWTEQSRLLPEVGQVSSALTAEWSVQEVADFVRKLAGCSECANLLHEQLVDGESFLLLSQADIVNILHVKLGPAVKIYNSIQMIKNN